VNWALKECKNALKIYENNAFHRLLALSVENIEEKNPLKSYPQPVHFTPLLLVNPSIWQDSGCPDKYMKTVLFIDLQL
jgi:hypothetical protein